MSKILLIYASRYGSTLEVAEIIAGKLKAAGAEVELSDVRLNPGIEEYDMVLLGAGIYSHKFLPELESFISANHEALLLVKVGLFGVAMRTEVVHKNGRSFGGELILDKYELNPAVKGMLHGRMDFSLLGEKDRAGLERFYVSIGLTEEQKADRRRLRDEISAVECADFAELVLSALR